MGRGMIDSVMADLEKLAVKRDRGYLVRLVLLLLLGTVGGIYIYAGLTGHRFSSCMADALGGLGAPTTSTGQ